MALNHLIGKTISAMIVIFIAPVFSKMRYRGSTFRPFTICVESGNKLHVFAALVAVKMKPCIVIVLDTLFKQAP